MWKLKQLLKRIAHLWRDRRACARTRKIKRNWATRLQDLPLAADGRRLLHIGCGEIEATGYVNLDARPGSHVHIVTQDLFRLEMIPEHAFDLVYMSHVLEHVSHLKVTETLRELRRILKVGGVLRVSVPEFDHILTLYQATDHDIRAIEQPLMGAQDYAFNYHYMIFNDGHLRKLMLNSGFREVRAWNPQDCDHHDFEDWASKTISWEGREYEISLNIEAVK